MADYVTDTHGLIWYLEDDPRLGSGANAAFEACDQGEGTIYVPTICLVEMLYLQEKGRISTNLKAQLDIILATGSSGLALFDLTLGVVRAMAQVPRSSVPDMPDRIIAATALHLSVPVISKDSSIQRLGIDFIW